MFTSLAQSAKVPSCIFFCVKYNERGQTFWKLRKGLYSDKLFCECDGNLSYYYFPVLSWMCKDQESS